MKEWIMSITGIIVFGVLLDVVLPHGKTAKYIKGIFAVLVVYVIVSPLPKLVKSGVKWAESFDETSFDFSLGDGGSFAGFGENLQNISEKTEKMLEVNGISGVKIAPRTDGYGNVSYVNVDFSASPKSVKTRENYLKTKLLVANYLNIKSEEVRILGTD